MIVVMSRATSPDVTRFADMLAAMGAEARLRVVRLLLEAHPEGMVAGELSSSLDIPPATLSHHLDRLKREGVVNVRRDGTFLWYTANTTALEDLLTFLFAECCTRNHAIKPERLTFIRGTRS
jgi:ArsR family transcriptional regulator, arsenate/arsenite/antimonite-responsive transcriptional repressor